MDMKENNKYRYTDTAERNIRMNRFYIIASSFLATVFLFYLWLKLINHNISPIVTYANTILIAVFCVVNVVTHLRNKATRLLKVFATIEIGIEYLLVGLQTDASFIHSHLSAVTEEVTANAEQVHTMSQNNLDCAEQVKTAVEHIRSTTDEMGTQEG